MKNSILCILFLSSAIISNAQFKVGFELGANLMGAEVILEDVLETDKTWGIRMGIVSEYHLSNSFYLKAAALVNQRGFKFADERWGLNVIDVPLNLGYKIPLNDQFLHLFFDAGANFEYNFGAFTKINGDLVKLSIGKNKDDIKPMAIGFNVGTGVQLTEKIKVRINYYRGLTNLVRIDEDKWKNQTIGLAFNIFF